MQYRTIALLVTAMAILIVGGCEKEGSVAPITPVEVQTDYDFVVINETGMDFVVYRKGSNNGYVWELMAPLEKFREVPYRSEVGATYLLFFCREGDAPEERYAGVNYGFNSTETQTWVLRTGD